MNNFWLIWKKEMAGYLLSMTGHVIITLNAFLLGGCFTLLMEVLNLEPTDVPITEIFYDSFFFWILLFLGAPIITMKAFATEAARGTLDSLLATPVPESTIVLAKWAACLSFFLLTWLPWIGCMAVVYIIPVNPPPFHWVQWLSTAIGIVLIGSFFISMGCFFSALTQNQIMSSMATLGVSLLLFSLSFADRWSNPNQSFFHSMMAQLGMVRHMTDFVRGILDTRPIVFYSSATAVFLFATTQVLQAKRWKS